MHELAAAGHVVHLGACILALVRGHPAKWLYVSWKSGKAKGCNNRYYF
jgi:hypothetical protein